MLFPLQWLCNLMPPWMWDYGLLLRPWLAALGVFLLLRRVIDPACAFFGGLMYSLSGVFTWFVQLQQFTNVAMMAPYAILAVDWLSRPNPSVQQRLLAAVFMALLMLAGQPEVAVPVLVLAGIWILTRSFDSHGARLHSLRSLLQASVVAVGLSAPLLLPFAEFANAAFHLHPAGGVMGSIAATPFQYVGALLLPTISYLPVPFTDHPHNGVWDVCGGYIGIIGALSALLAWFAPAGLATRLARVTGVFALVIVLKNIGWPPFVWLGRLPLIDQIWTPRWAGPAWVLALCLGAACGAHAWFERSPSVREGRGLRRIVGVMAGGLWIWAAILAWLFATRRPMTTAEHWLGAIDATRTIGFETWLALGVATVLELFSVAVLLRAPNRERGMAALGFLSLAELSYVLPLGYDDETMLWALMPAAILVACALALLAARTRVAYLLSVLALFCHLLVDHSASSGLPSRPADREPPYARYLAEHAGLDRVVGIGDLLYPNGPSRLGLHSVHFVVALQPQSVHRMVRSMQPAGYRWFLPLWFTGIPMLEKQLPATDRLRTGMETLAAAAQQYAFLGVRYIAVRRQYESELLRLAVPGTFARRWGDERVAIYENPYALPRAFIASAVELRADEQPALVEIDRRSGSPRVRVSVDRGIALPPAAANSLQQVRIETYTSDEVTLVSRTAAPALVVLTDAFEDGWLAWVDASPTPVVKVAGSVRGVFVPPGEHRILMQYSPNSWNLGVFLCGMAAVAGLAWLALDLRRRRLALAEQPV
ncbi:MAG: YfhO family protein [Myxococcales bacterium]|nr:YfhO family protein [Myxococcales bacterium]